MDISESYYTPCCDNLGGSRLRKKSQKPIKAGVGVVLAIIGVALIFLRSVTPDRLVDYVWIAGGIALVLIYCVISWDWFKSFFGKDASMALVTPPLLTFGVLAVYSALTATWLVSPHDMVMLGLGAALIVVPLVLLFRAVKR